MVCTAATGFYDLGMDDQLGNSAGNNLNFPFELVLEAASHTQAALPGSSARGRCYDATKCQANAVRNCERSSASLAFNVQTSAEFGSDGILAAGSPEADGKRCLS